MTAPAIVRRWNDPPPARVGRSLPERPIAVARKERAGDAVQARVREWAARVWRVAPLGAVLLTGLVGHVAVAPHLALRGAAPDVLLVGVAAVAVRRGARTGAGFGFAAGLGADVFLATPLGTSALAYTLVGHALGRSSRPRTSGAAAALCRPGSTCFACRAGRRHDGPPAPEAAGRPSRVRRRAASRRTALRRSVALTALAVASGRIGTAVVATALAGAAFPGTPGLLRIAGVAAVSAPLGPMAGAAVRRAHPRGAAG